MNLLRRNNIQYLNGSYSFLKGLIISVKNMEQAADLREQIIKEHETVKMISADLPGIRKLQQSINEQALNDQNTLKQINRHIFNYKSGDKKGYDKDDFIYNVFLIMKRFKN